MILSFISCKTETKPKTEYIEKNKSETIDNLANRYLDLNRFSGVILITKGDTTIYNKNFGLADFENDKPFSNKTALRLAKFLN